MAMTFLDQQNKLSRLLGDSNTSSEDMWPLADRKFEINRGEIQFGVDSGSTLEYATTVINGDEASLPDDFSEMHQIIVGDYVLGNDRELSVSDLETVETYSGDIPYYYYWEYSGVKILKFVGASDGQTCELYYFRKATTDLVDDTDESIHEDEYREASVYYAASELLEQIGKTQLSDRYRAKYDNLVFKASTRKESKYLKKVLPRPDLVMDETRVEEEMGYNQGQGL